MCPKDILLSVYITAKTTCSFHHLTVYTWMIYIGGVISGRVAYWLRLLELGRSDPSLCPWARRQTPTCPIILRRFGWELAKNVSLCFMLLHSNKTSHLITSLPLFSPFKDRQGRGSRDRERTSEQVLFLWLSPSSEEEVKTFSPLITLETTWRVDLSRECVCMCAHEVIRREDCVGYAEVLITPYCSLPGNS